MPFLLKTFNGCSWLLQGLFGVLKDRVSGALPNTRAQLYLSPAYLHHNTCYSDTIICLLSCLFLQTSSQQTFSLKGQIVNTFRFVGHVRSVTTTQLCLYSTKQPWTICKQVDKAVFQ